jgi:hypothetical protein
LQTLRRQNLLQLAPNTNPVIAGVCLTAIQVGGFDLVTTAVLAIVRQLLFSNPALPANCLKFMAFDVPILFCVFNRPELTSRVFEAIARRRPKTLLIAGDGPRSNWHSDPDLVQQTRDVVSRIDWQCDVRTRFSPTNLGCRRQMAEAITWGFEEHERLIILEDDCVPNDSFFSYCREMLDRYEDQPQVMTVSGNSYPTTGYRDDSYRFSKYPLIWGWASWRRAWQHYDLKMNNWRSVDIQKKVLDRFTSDEQEREFWRDIFDRQHRGQINTWDYSWTFACWENNGLAVLPRENLVSNIGFGDHATHTFDITSPMANRQTRPLTIDRHPDRIDRDLEADEEVRRIVFEPECPLPPARRSVFSRLWNFSSTSLFHSRQMID